MGISLGFVFPNVKCIAYLLLLSASFLNISSAVEELPNPNNPTALFFFGDGFYDTGNRGRIETDTDSNYNHPPYGITYFDISTGRPSDGRLITDYIADKVLLEPAPYSITPYRAQIKSMWRYGVSFATIGASATKFNDKKELDFSEQLNHFNEVSQYLVDTYGEEVAQKVLSKSIYIFSLGVVDFINLRAQKYASVGETTDAIFEKLEQVIKSIHEKGGRKFAFQNVAPFELMPYYTNKYAVDESKTLCELVNASKSYNELLKIQLHHWATCWEKKDAKSSYLDGFSYSYLDYYTFLLNVQRDEKEKACCGSGKNNGELTCGNIIGKDQVNVCDINSNELQNYLWFDALHPTSLVHEEFVDQIWNKKKYVVSNTLKQLYDEQYDDDHHDPDDPVPIM